MRKEPKIVIWDLETLPDPEVIYSRIPSIGAWPGRTFKADLQSIITFGYKIVGQETKTVSGWDFPEWHNNIGDDSAIVAFAYEVLHDADEIVTHNGKRFDVKVLNTRLMMHGMPPLAPTNHVDTKVVAKRGLSLYSNSLAEVAKFFGVEDKMHFSDKWSLWTRIAFGRSTREDRKLMDDYCKQDVDTLYEVYKKLRPFHGNSAVNKNLFDERGVCPTCGSPEIIKHGVKRTRTQEFNRFLCKSCGSVSQQTKKGVIK